MFKSIGERYRKARKKLGLSLRQAERSSGIKNTSINKVELDKTESPNHKYTTFLIKQGINPYFLVGLSDEIKGELLETISKSEHQSLQTEHEKLKSEFEDLQNKYEMLQDILQVKLDEDGNFKKRNK